jgi:hypothetical protein
LHAGTLPRYEAGLMRRRITTLVSAAACMAAAVLPAAAQRPTGPPTSPADTAGAFLDAGAAALMDRARQQRQVSDGSLRSYTAISRSRSAFGLRMPLKDRTLLRSESAARIRWSRDADDVVQILAARTQTPVGVEPDWNGMAHRPFDPRNDRLYFGMMRDSVRDGRRANVSDDDDFYIEHPLGAYAERHYRYQSGDTMIIRMQDGRTLRVAELVVLPRRSDPQTVRGTLWIEIGSAAVVRAAFRLARRMDIMQDMPSAMDDDDFRTISRIPLITPMEFDISLMTLEYSLWDMRHWMPRSMRLEGVFRAGVFTAPGSFEVSYQMLEVLTDRDDVQQTEAELVAQTLREWRDDAGPNERVSWTQGRRENRARVISPRDEQVLLESDLLPPPIWENAPGFPTEQEIREVYDRLAKVPVPAHPGLPIRFGWGWGEPGMLRYNRVEALSVGARVVAPLPYVTVEGVARLGAADLHPNAELTVHRETMRRTVEFRGYHQLSTADESRRAFGAGNSMSALLLGRDEGEYFRATGASVTIAPPSLRRRSWDARLYAESHDAVERGTHVALPRVWNDSIFRENISAYETRQLGAALQFRPWWGTDPMAAQFGIDMLLQGELTEFPDVRQAAWYDLPRDHVVRGRVTLRGALPLGAGVRAGAEAAAGAARGSLAHSELHSVPPQRRFHLGGASTLRGFEPGTLYGDEMLRGRLELARTIPAVGLAIFSDYAATRTDTEWHRLMSAGVGITVLDGLLRVDLARGIGTAHGWQAERAPRRWRLDLHLDAVL